ncbi:MAG: glycosyltransferase [Nitrososphaerota archaeon]|nr:glycosyltransferase [Nitrososphaerota archaeon]
MTEETSSTLKPMARAEENVMPSDTIAKLREQVTVVIPTLNEEEAIGPLIDEVKAAGYNNILVVDGYSKDRTVEVAKARGVMVIGQHGKGKTGAVLVARDVVNTPYFLLMDGDYSYDPKDIDRFIVHANGYDHIIGFRPRDSPHISRTHKVGNKILTVAFNLLMGSNVPDVACGMYLMRTEKVKQLVLTRFGFEIDQEIAAQMLTDGKVTYVPINYRQRLGKVKAPTWRQGFRALLFIIGLGLRYNPILLFSVAASLVLIPAFGLLLYASYLLLMLHQYHGGYFLAGLTLLVLGAQGFTVATIASMLGRIERKLSKM